MSGRESIDARLVSLLWAGAERATEIARIHAAAFSPAWDTDAVSRLLQHPASIAFVAETGTPRKVIGFVMGQIAADEAEILSIAVAPEWQRQGVGRILVEGLARAARKADGKRLFLEVAADNEAAYALYRGLGFGETGRRKAYYERPGGTACDALQLQLAL